MDRVPLVSGQGLTPDLGRSDPEAAGGPTCPQVDSPSAETNCPTAEDTPPLPSTNWTSDTMMLSSRTEPQPVHTALPRAWSTSMSDPPQVLHTRELMVEVRGQLGLEVRGGFSHEDVLLMLELDQPRAQGMNRSTVRGGSWRRRETRRVENENYNS